ncbi:ComF family protein [Halobacillus yeomjeoni]|uniref:ComF family protein n=1 Tax=Halobacillus yeomjeoni TaxID=311194 RepID=A0A931HWX7_9BACI|nr:ComF family protein [Halobacillus yeomjeoni]MBH0230875.1 ComF family protein [Halobacillus yeomjeoni]
MRCYVCHQEIMLVVTWDTFWRPPKKEKICNDCLDEMKVLGEAGCPVCSREDSTGVCFDCKRWTKSHPDLLKRNTSVYHYNGFAKDLVARWKYRGDYVLIQSVEEQIVKAFDEAGYSKWPLIPIPLSDEREKERGFNQSEAIIELLNKSPVQALVRSHSEKQSKKGRLERIHSQNPFTLVEPIGKPVVLVDDIYTTGTTVRHAASLLTEQGCPEVYSFTVFR